MAMLTQLNSQVLMGQGQIVSVVAEAGSGKSRLLQEFQRSLDEEETMVLTGQCQSNGVESPYLPFIDVIQEAFVMEGVPAAEMQDHVVGKIRQLNPELEPYLPHCLHILSIHSEEFALPENLDADSKRLALQEALVALLTAATQMKSSVLLLEDWHWADAASTAVLQKLIDVSSAYPFMLIVSHRPEYEANWIHHLNCSQVKIPPLNPVACNAIMRSVIGAENIPDSLNQLVFDRTGGNPFFIEEICKSLEEEGVISVTDKVMTLHQDPDDLDLPDTVQAVIRTRLDQLDPVSHQVLCSAAVIGREFNLGLLESVSGGDSSLRMVLGMLSGAGMIAQIRTLPEPVYMFRHVLTQVVAYESLLQKQKSKIHELTGTAIESLYPDRVDEFLERLVFHFDNSGNDIKAINYSIRAGQKATSQAACNEAVKHYTRALELLEKQPESEQITHQRFDIYLELAQQLILTDGYASDRVVHAFDTARKLNKVIGDQEKFFPTLWGLWRVNYVRSLYDEALELSGELLEIATNSGDSNLLSAARTARSVSHYWLGQLPDQIRHSDLAIELMDVEHENKYGYRHSIQPGIMNLCFRQSAEFAMGLHAEAVATREQLHKLTQDVNHPPSEIFSLFYQGVSYTFDHQPEPANRLFLEVMEIAEREHFPYLVSLAKFHQARLLIYQGKFDECIAGMSVHQEALDKMGLTVTAGLYNLISAALYQQQGLVEKGLEHIEKAMNSLPYLDVDIHRVKADLLANDHPEEALEWYEKAIAISRQQGAKFFELKATTGFAMLQLKLGNPQPAISELQEICDWFPEDNSAPELAGARQFLTKVMENTGQ
jgi:tetratricopeptide (TPR) repeat protein/energy-coupling factor transporter ATP-binding protein EcfA2